MMSRIAHLTQIEGRLLLREPLAGIFVVGFPLTLLFLLLATFDTQPDVAFGGLNAPDYYVPAYAAGIAAAAGLVGLPVHLASYLDVGVLRRFRASGIHPLVVVASQVLVNVALALVSAGLLVAMGAGAYALSAPSSWVAVVTAFVLAAVTLSVLGTAVSALVRRPRAAQGVGLLLFFGMFFLAGGGPPESLLPPSVGAVADVLPMTYAVALLRDLWVGRGWDLTAVLVLVAVAVASTAVAVRRLRRG